MNTRFPCEPTTDLLQLVILKYYSLSPNPEVLKVIGFLRAGQYDK